MEEKYELIDIDFCLEYDIPTEKQTFVSEDLPPGESGAEPTIEYDAEGIPMGSSKEEIKMRQKLIFLFYDAWKSANQERAVYNKNLKDNILIRNESVIEAAAHAAKRYKSTLAVFKLNEVLANAEMVDTDVPKLENKNQKKLVKMILMSYKCQGIGTIKLTVGVRRRSMDKIQYGITALKEGEKIVPVAVKKKKKTSHKK